MAWRIGPDCSYWLERGSLYGWLSCLCGSLFIIWRAESGSADRYIQVVVLVAGGFAITGIVLSLVGDGAGVFAGLGTLMGEIQGIFK